MVSYSYKIAFLQAKKFKEIIIMAQIKDGKLIFKVATYNVAALGYCDHDPSVIGRDIAESEADIVGLQEIDMFLRRSGEINMAAEIAEAAGYPYYRFIRAIDYQGGQYGTTILSKYPIRKLELINLASTNEKRSLGRFVIDILGCEINFFNTHLSYIEPELLDHIDQVARILEGYESYVITADYNTCNFGLLEAFHGHRMANNAENELYSFPSTKAGIDNIIMTEDFDYSDPYLGPEGHSDHRMLVATLTKAVD